MNGFINIDIFAGGGGASEAMTQAGYPPHVALNHDPEAIAVHAANHPDCEHICQDVGEAKPLEVTRGRPVAGAWFSPDCTDHSKAKGGKPRDGKRRALAWVVRDYADDVGPEVIWLENVEEFAEWGPLNRYNKRIMSRRGETFTEWVNAIEALGYRIGWHELRACDYGAPTTRNRLFLCARRDGMPIVRPAPTHARDGAGGLQPWRTAAEIIDFSLPCPSIFMTREEALAYYKATGIRVQRPLAEKTMIRIAKGVCKYVINSAAPFIIPITHTGARVHSIAEPLRTITCAHRGEHALVTAFLAQHNNHRGVVPSAGRDVQAPLSTVTVRGTQQQLVMAHMLNLKGEGRFRSPDAPMFTQCAGGWHIAEVRAFLTKYHWTGGQLQDLRDPLHTMETKARFGLVTVAGTDYGIADIGMRMLTLDELKRGQGLPDDYELRPMLDGRRLTNTSAIAKVGNSVSPFPARAWIQANAPRREL